MKNNERSGNANFKNKLTATTTTVEFPYLLKNSADGGGSCEYDGGSKESGFSSKRRERDGREWRRVQEREGVVVWVVGSCRVREVGG